MTTEYQITRRIDQIKEILEEIPANYNDMDMLKTAVEVYNIARGEDGVIADNMRDYWKCLNSGAEK